MTCPVFGVHYSAVLGIANPRNVAARLPEDCVCQMDVTDALGRVRQTNVVNLKGLNRVILDSTKEDVERFKDWVAEVITQIQTTGRYDLAEQQTVMLDAHQPVAHLAEATRKQTSKNVNGIAYAHAGSQGARDVNIGMSLHFFGATPKQMSKQIQAECGRKYAKSKSLPQVLTENVPHVAASYSVFKHMSLLGHDAEMSKTVAKAFEPGFQAAIEAGLDPQSLLPQP